MNTGDQTTADGITTLRTRWEGSKTSQLALTWDRYAGWLIWHCLRDGNFRELESIDNSQSKCSMIEIEM
jgi:hypothetical protein